jgi:hypothetical protein
MDVLDNEEICLRRDSQMYFDPPNKTRILCDLSMIAINYVSVSSVWCLTGSVNFLSIGQ